MMNLRKMENSSPLKLFSSIGVFIRRSVIGAAAMLTVACATGLATAMAGAVLFCLADVVFGWGRFVGKLPRERLLTMTLYHPAQFGLVLGLVEAAR